MSTVAALDKKYERVRERERERERENNQHRFGKENQKISNSYLKCLLLGIPMVALLMSTPTSCMILMHHMCKAFVGTARITSGTCIQKTSISMVIIIIIELKYSIAYC